MGKRIIHIIIWITAVILIAVSFGFSVIESRKMVCGDIKVNVTDSADIRFISGREIEQLIKVSYRGVMGGDVNDLNLRKIEEGLKKLQPIQDISVYTNLFENGSKSSGSLVIRIKQRKPVCRVFSSERSYYIDKFGKYISWSPRYTPRVIVVGGDFSNEYANKKLIPLIDYINQDKFWSAQIDQIYVASNGELSMVPRVGDHMIIFGAPEDHIIKFRNLKALYSEGFKDGGWSLYKRLNAKYLNQIICTKK